MTRALDPIRVAIDEALDTRRDPLDDPRVAAFLADDPRAAREYAELASTLERVARGGARVRRPRLDHARRKLLVRAAAAALVACFALASFLASRARDGAAEVADGARGAPARPAQSTEPLDRATDTRQAAKVASAIGISHYRIEHTLATPHAIERLVVEDGRVTSSTKVASSSDALAVTIEHTTWAARGRELR